MTRFPETGEHLRLSGGDGVTDLDALSRKSACARACGESFQKPRQQASPRHPLLSDTLPNWLHELRSRSVTINMAGSTPTLRGAAVTQTDLDMAARYTHALHLAATGTHPTWWTYASGRDRTRWPHVDDLPWTCATCGTPDCPYLDADLVAWCDRHDLEHQP